MVNARKRFILLYPTRDARQFAAFARSAARLKKYGRVLLDVSTLADQSFHEVPPGGSSWHDYTTEKPSFFKVVPHPKIAPFLPADYIRRNRDLLRAKSATLKKLGLGAAFHGQEPYFAPEAFLRKYPGLRGPRVDHPRRSTREEFALCTDLPEVAAMYEWMMGELKRKLPMLEAYSFNTNDAGSAFCWAAAQYAGANGPRACMGKTAGRRVREFMETLHRGAVKAGGDVSVYIDHVNFWRNEEPEVLRALPPNSFLARLTPTVVVTGSLSNNLYPVLGMVNPLAVMAAAERFNSDRADTAFIHLGGTYRRHVDTPETIDRVIELVTDGIDRPVKGGLRGRLDRLKEYCEKWGGKEKADALFEAFVVLDRALALKDALVPGWNPQNSALSMRHLTRPLVFKPELLTRDEERHFLPHVFNIREAEARTDYIDLHGSRMSAPTGDGDGIPALMGCLDTLRGVASTLEGCRKAPAGDWLFDLGTSVRIFVACTRSTYNFYFAQLVRDRHRVELARENYVPVKEASWDGEGGILRFNELMRDEFDNANELIALFEERGLGRIGHASDERHQDTFRFGPDLVGDLKKKVKIMRDHWLDVEKFLAPPHK